MILTESADPEPDPEHPAHRHSIRGPDPTRSESHRRPRLRQHELRAKLVTRAGQCANAVRSDPVRSVPGARSSAGPGRSEHPAGSERVHERRPRGSPQFWPPTFHKAHQYLTSMHHVGPRNRCRCAVPSALDCGVCRRPNNFIDASESRATPATPSPGGGTLERLFGFCSRRPTSRTGYIISMPSYDVNLFLEWGRRRPPTGDPRRGDCIYVFGCAGRRRHGNRHPRGRLKKKKKILWYRCSY